MFDACGDVLGVLWAGSPSRNLSNAGRALRSALAALPQQRPPLPAGVPEALTFEGSMVWHYGPDPPAGVDCSKAEGDWWVGLAGRRHQINGAAGVKQTGACGHAATRVIAFDRAPHEPSPDGTGLCIARHGVADGLPLVRSVLHESTETLGSVRLISLAAPTRCDVPHTHELRIEFDQPQPFTPWTTVGDLIDQQGRRVRREPHMAPIGPTSGVFAQNSQYTGAAVFWNVPDGFVPVRMYIEFSGRSWNVDLQPPRTRKPSLRESARLAVRVSRGGAVEVCVEVERGRRVCPVPAAAAERLDSAAGWPRSGLVEWRAPLAAETLAALGESAAGCAVTEQLGELAWQMTVLSGNGTAVYVGNEQFITSARLFSDAAPQGAASQGGVTRPIVRAASNARNGLALVEVIGGPAATGRRDPVRFAASAAGIAEAEAAPPLMVAYPQGEADRAALTRLQVRELTERLIWHDGWGWDRTGAPLVDPCPRAAAGLSTGRDQALRAETVGAVLSGLRQPRAAPALAEPGPPLHGSIALLPQPVYLGTEQPDFGGWLCNVRPSERCEVLYAVYLAADSSLQISSVVGGEQRGAGPAAGKTSSSFWSTAQMSSSALSAPNPGSRGRRSRRLL